MGIRQACAHVHAHVDAHVDAHAHAHDYIGRNCIGHNYVGLKISAHEMHWVFWFIDKNGNGEIDHHELVQFIERTDFGRVWVSQMQSGVALGG